VVCLVELLCDGGVDFLLEALLASNGDHATEAPGGGGARLVVVVVLASNGDHAIVVVLVVVVAQSTFGSSSLLREVDAAGRVESGDQGTMIALSSFRVELLPAMLALAVGIVVAATAVVVVSVVLLEAVVAMVLVNVAVLVVAVVVLVLVENMAASSAADGITTQTKPDTTSGLGERRGFSPLASLFSQQMSESHLWRALPHVKALQPGAARHAARQVSALLTSFTCESCWRVVKSMPSANPQPSSSLPSFHFVLSCVALRASAIAGDVRQANPDTTPPFATFFGFSPMSRCFKKQTWVTPAMLAPRPQVQASHRGSLWQASWQASALLTCSMW